MEGNQNVCCKCPHHKAKSILVILFGLTFLLGTWDVLSADTVSVTWPILVILGGVFKMCEESICKCC